MSAAAEESFGLCPVCSRRTLKTHCPSPNCNWHRCISPTCEAVLDLRKRQGYRKSDDRKGFTRVLLGGL